MEDTQKQDKLPPIKYTKRVGHLFEHVRDIDNLKEAIKDAARHKRKRKEVQKVLEDIDGHALELQRMLDEETFIPAQYTMRRINDGIQKKTRDIAIPRFWPDQCVHHAFVRIFKQIVLHSAYPFSCGCVPGKGTHGAKTAIEKWIRKDPKHTKYVLKLDVRKCYPTMNHEELRKKLQRRIKDKKFLRLADRIIASFQQPMDTHEKGEKEHWKFADLEKFMRQFIQVLYAVKNYLLDVNCLSLDPGHIYVSDEIYYFCYCPGLEGNILEKFHELTEYFVRETDYEQKEAVYLAYELHKASMEENYNIEYALERILEKKENEMESIQPEKKAGYDLQEELILDDWIAEQEMKGQVVKDRQSVWGFLNQRLQKRRKKRESQWDEIMADDSEE